VEDEISLMWQKQDKENGVSLSEETKKDLDFDYLCEHVTTDQQEQGWIKSILSNMTCDCNTIQYRSDIFSEIMENKPFKAELKEVVLELKVLDNYKTVKLVTYDYSSIWGLINRLKELYAYINCIEKMNQVLSKYQFQSEGLNQLKQTVGKIYTDSGFKYLKQDIENLTDDVSQIKSLTLGVNLDENLQPREVQLISMNKTEFKENENGLLRAFVTCFAGSMANSLLKKSDDIDPLMNALTQRVEKMLEVVVNNMKLSLNKYVDINGYAITKLIPELIFYIRFSDLYEKIQKNGNPVCKAECIRAIQKTGDSIQTKLNVLHFYNLKLAMHESENDWADEIITNEMFFDDKHMQYILTGPNRGGKTIFTQGIGLLFVLAQSGVYVPAEKMSFVPVDNIFTHFPADENKTVELGRLGEEAERIEHIFEQASEQSLVLLNESLSTTNFTEGLYIAKDVVRAFNYMGTRIIYNTHMHDLAINLPILNCNGNDCVVSLVMGIDGGKRNYHAFIAPPTGNSYARDIAQKYGILFEQMKDVIDKKN
jgi:dsDNA-specific endonuclease/ATPase MutS2